MSRAKGARREREARRLYERAGYDVQPFYGRQYGETDGFGLFDLVALAGGRRPVFVQVKSNRAEGIVRWSETVAEQYAGRHARFHYAVCHDRDGWRLIAVDPSGFRTVVDERGEGVPFGSEVVMYLQRRGRV